MQVHRERGPDARVTEADLARDAQKGEQHLQQPLLSTTNVCSRAPVCSVCSVCVWCGRAVGGAVSGRAAVGHVPAALRRGGPSLFAAHRDLQPRALRPPAPAHPLLPAAPPLPARATAHRLPGTPLVTLQFMINIFLRTSQLPRSTPQGAACPATGLGRDLSPFISSPISRKDARELTS